MIQADKGRELFSRNLDAWAYLAKVNFDFIQLENLTDNAFIESFNARVRREFLNAHFFESLEDATNILINWRIDYNTLISS